MTLNKRYVYEYRGTCGHSGCPRTLDEWTRLAPTSPGWARNKDDLFCPEHRRDALRECAVCERKIRPKGTRLDHWPDTVARSTDGQCRTCYTSNPERQLDRAIEQYNIKNGKA